MNAQPRVPAQPAVEQASNRGTPDNRDKTAGPPVTQDAWRVYKRLLGYARPHLGMFMIGVVGMLLFAASDAALVWLVKEFFKGAFVKPDPRTLALVPPVAEPELPVVPPVLVPAVPVAVPPVLVPAVTLVDVPAAPAVETCPPVAVPAPPVIGVVSSDREQATSERDPSKTSECVFMVAVVSGDHVRLGFFYAKIGVSGR